MYTVKSPTVIGGREHVFIKSTMIGEGAYCGKTSYVQQTKKGTGRGRDDIKHSYNHNKKKITLRSIEAEIVVINTEPRATTGTERYHCKPFVNHNWVHAVLELKL